MIVISEDKRIEVMQKVIDNYLKPKFISLGMNASGRWLNSLEARADGIWGMDYTYYLVNGRANGKIPPIQPLISWVGSKFGLYGQEAKSAAFAIAIKIEREGTEYYPDGTDLLEVLQSKEVRQFVYDEMKSDISSQLQIEIKRRLTLTLA